jgi:hypothetical protein
MCPCPIMELTSDNLQFTMVQLTNFSTLVQKGYTFSRNCTSNLEFGYFLRLTHYMHCDPLSCAQLPSAPKDK